MLCFRCVPASYVHHLTSWVSMMARYCLWGLGCSSRFLMMAAICCSHHHVNLGAMHVFWERQEIHNDKGPDRQLKRGTSKGEQLTYDVAPPPSALMEFTTCMHGGVCCVHSSAEFRHQAEELTSVEHNSWDLQTRQSTPGCSGWRQGLAGSWLWPS